MYDRGAPRIGKGRCCRRCNRHPIFIVDIGDNSSYDEPWPSGIFRVGSFFVRLSMLSLLHRSCTFLSPAVWSVRPRPWVHSFDLLAHLEPTTSLATRFDELERTRTPNHRRKREREKVTTESVIRSLSTLFSSKRMDNRITRPFIWKSIDDPEGISFTTGKRYEQSEQSSSTALPV